MLEVGNILSIHDSAKFLNENNIGIVIILDYIKARDWPRKGYKLTKESVRVPLLWGVLSAHDEKSLKIEYDVHPAKCLPQRYNKYNMNPEKNPVVLETGKGGTLAGCGRTYVEINGYKHCVNEKIPEYCSVFGMPHDCCDPDFEMRMLEFLKTCEALELWCFERTEYIEKRVDNLIKLHYMKGEFLPSRYFLYVDSSSNFLKAIFSTGELELVNQEIWFSGGKEFVEKMDYTGPDYLRFEEEALCYIKKNLSYEFVRQLLLMINKRSFTKLFSPKRPKLDSGIAKKVQANIESIINETRKENDLYMNDILETIKRYLTGSFRSSRFLILDAEYVPVKFPTGNKKTFNFPCIFSSIAWLGDKEGLRTDINVFDLPCHSCGIFCSFFKKNCLNFDCLLHGLEFIERQISIVEEMLSEHEGLKIHSYGRSDIFQLEYASNFFSDSFEIRQYERKNRKRSKCIIEVSSDLFLPQKDLACVESEIISKWIHGWSRKNKHFNICNRFMTKWGSNSWEVKYRESIRACVDDAISAFLYLLHRDYRKTDESIEFPTQTQTSLEKFFLN
jgi:hypothetical protein